MEKPIQQPLTNETLRRKFSSQFELVNYAIRLAENMIVTGRAPRIKSDNDNRALWIIHEIREGKDYFDAIDSKRELEAASSFEEIKHVDMEKKRKPRHSI